MEDMSITISHTGRTVAWVVAGTSGKYKVFSQILGESDISVLVYGQKRDGAKTTRWTATMVGRRKKDERTIFSQSKGCLQSLVSRIEPGVRASSHGNFGSQYQEPPGYQGLKSGDTLPYWIHAGTFGWVWQPMGHPTVKGPLLGGCFPSTSQGPNPAHRLTIPPSSFLHPYSALSYAGLSQSRQNLASDPGVFP